METLTTTGYFFKTSICIASHPVRMFFRMRKIEKRIERKKVGTRHLRGRRHRVDLSIWRIQARLSLTSHHSLSKIAVSVVDVVVDLERVE